MLRVGCWMGRLVLDCTECEWQDPPAESLLAEEARDLGELVDKGVAHVAEAHAGAAWRGDEAGVPRCPVDGQWCSTCRIGKGNGTGGQCARGGSEREDHAS